MSDIYVPESRGSGGGMTGFGDMLDERLLNERIIWLEGEVRDENSNRIAKQLQVLAAEEPLSLQAHPSAEQAVEGYVREDRVGVPLNSPIRNYRDRSHKPELLVALGEYVVAVERELAGDVAS